MSKKEECIVYKNAVICLAQSARSEIYLTRIDGDLVVVVRTKRKVLKRDLMKGFKNTVNVFWRRGYIYTNMHYSLETCTSMSSALYAFMLSLEEMEITQVEKLYSHLNDKT